MATKKRKTKTKRLQIMVDEDLKKAVEKAADYMGLDVSNWARLAFREKINKGKD